MKKFRLHPLFFVVCVFLILINKAPLLLSTLICVFLHEFSHYLSARRRGYTLSGFTLMPYGAVLSADTGLGDNDLFAVSVAGPAVNLLLATVTVATWWIFPATYSYTLPLFQVNLALALFNLLPFYPLDGSRIILSLCKDKIRAIKVMKILGYVFSFILAILFVISAFFTVSYTLALASLTIYIGAAMDADKEKYILLCNKIHYIKDFSRPIEKKEVYIHVSAPLSSLLKYLVRECYYIVRVVDGNMRLLRTVEENELERLFYIKDRSVTVGNALGLGAEPYL